MREPTERETEQYQKLIDLFTKARQRYLEAGGNPYQSGGSLNQRDCLTEEEKREIRELRKQVFVDNYPTFNAQIKKPYTQE
jgi:hypothetical protein